MTLPPIIRIFFAIELPTQLKKQLGEYLCQLKKTAKSNAIRWSRPENLHITLQFLPEVNTFDLPNLVTKVRERLNQHHLKPFIRCGKPILFPNPYRPRVIVLEITPQTELATLACVIGEGITSLHYPVETRPFRAHLTLGRIKYSKGVDLNFLSACLLPELGHVETSEVVLFRSEPLADRSQYTVLERIELG